MELRDAPMDGWLGCSCLGRPGHSWSCCERLVDSVDPQPRGRQSHRSKQRVLFLRTGVHRRRILRRDGQQLVLIAGGMMERAHLADPAHLVGHIDQCVVPDTTRLRRRRKPANECRDHSVGAALGRFQVARRARSGARRRDLELLRGSVMRDAARLHKRRGLLHKPKYLLNLGGFLEWLHLADSTHTQPCRH
jgi:hypothetical protein